MLPIAFLVVLTAVLGAAFVAHTDTMCYGDCVVEYAPKFASFARGVQSGSLPLADLNTFSGARQHYLSSIQLYYPLLYPLYWVADPEDLRQAAALLIVGPYALHLLWAALGTYAFARLCVRVSPVAALASAMVYAFSSTLLTLDFLNQTFALSYLPWVTLAAALVIQRGSAKAWAWGALLLGAMNVASHANVAIRLWFVIGLASVVLAALTRRATAGRHEASGSFQAIARRLLAVAGMGAIGLGVASYGWAGVYNGLMWIGATENLSCDKVMDFAQGSSLPLIGLLSLFFPYSFSEPGSSIVLGGGIVLVQVVGLAIAVAILRLRVEANREWLLIGVGLLGFGIVVMLGKYTPAFGLLCRTMPLFFGYPHPVSWGILVSWGLSILSGIGVARLLTNPSAIQQWALLLVTVAVAGAAAILQPAIPTYRWDGPLLDARLYVAIVAAACAGAALLPGRFRGRALAILLLAECLIAPLRFVVSPPGAVVADPRDHSRWTLRNEPYKELRPILREVVSQDSVRFTGVNSYLDNQAWNVNAHALLGYQPVALYPGFAEAVQRITDGRPYSLWLKWLPRFLQNMNTGLLVSYRGADDLPDLPWFNRWYEAVYARVIQPLRVVRQTKHFEILEIPSPLPYAYAQDQVESLEPADQLRLLMQEDLRQAVYVDPKTFDEFPWPKVAGSAEGDVVSRFEDLQRIDRVLRIDRSKPNHVSVDVAFEKPAMLVIAETGMPGWRATVDGRAAAILRVNYLQQGLWLDKGSHEVDLRFLPSAFVYGTALSFLSLGAVGFVVLRARGREASV